MAVFWFLNRSLVDEGEGFRFVESDLVDVVCSLFKVSS